MTTDKSRSGPRKFAWFLAVALALLYPLLPLLAYGQQQRKPLSESEISHLLRNHVPPESIAEIAGFYRISFEIDPNVAVELRRTGATEQLISKLKEYQPIPAAPPSSNFLSPSAATIPNSPVLIISSAIGDAEIYLDDAREGKTSSDGLLKVLHLAPGPHKVRASRPGYSDFQTMVELQPGETTTAAIPPLQATLLPLPSPPEATTSKSGVGTTAALPSPSTHLDLAAKKTLPLSARQPVVVHGAFHIVGVPALRRNKKFDLEITSNEMLFLEGGRHVYSIPFERIERVQMNPEKRDYAKATYVAVVALGVAGALLLANPKNVDALVVNYKNEKGGTMWLVIQVPQGRGTPCLDQLARGGIPIGPDQEIGS